MGEDGDWTQESEYRSHGHVRFVKLLAANGIR